MKDKIVRDARTAYNTHKDTAKESGLIYKVTYTRQMATGERLLISDMLMTEVSLFNMLSKEGRACKFGYIVISATLVDAKTKGLFNLHTLKKEQLNAA